MTSITSPTTHTVELFDCPACRDSVIADLTYSVKVNERVYGPNETPSHIDKTATAALTLTGVRLQHECNGLGDVAQLYLRRKVRGNDLQVSNLPSQRRWQ